MFLIDTFLGKEYTFCTATKERRNTHDQIDGILEAIIRKGIALEINTSSYDLLNETLPGRELVQRYYDMGGYLVTLGSDAHAAENAAKAFHEALTMLKEIGFENIYYYKGRKAYQCKIV